MTPVLRRLVGIYRTLLMRVLPLWMLRGIHKYPERDKQLIYAIRTIVGSSPMNLELYKLATRHISVAEENDFGLRESNERLEFLGDAILGSVVADYLFKKYPYKDEGFLTEIRSRIVNREALNSLARKIGIRNIIEFDKSGIPVHRKTKLSHKSIDGDTLEALVGAVYLDRGFARCKKFILHRLLFPHFDLDKIVTNNPNYKSTIIEWAQKCNREIRFEIIDTRGDNQFKEFVAQIILDEQPICTGSGYSKKKAEQSASRKALEILDTSDHK